MDIALKVPNLSIIFMIITLVICFCYPIGMAVYLRVKKKANISAFFIGCGVFIVFVIILESIVNQLVIDKTGSVGTTIYNNIWLKALYGGLAAGLFEETGRWLSFKVLLKNKRKPSNALMYSAGHGGVEAIIFVGLTYVVNVVVSFMLNAGNVATLLADTTNANAVFDSFATLASTPPTMFLMGGVERIIAITLHICLSVFVYKAVTETGKKYYFIFAILIHAGVNFLAVIVSNYSNIYVTELILVILVVALVIITKRIYGQLSRSNEVDSNIIEAVNNDTIILQNSDNDKVEILDLDEK